MSSGKPIRSKGATSYDLASMSDEDFERMVARLVRLEHRSSFKPANVSDGGVDMVLPKADRSGYARCWQAKHYPKNIRWPKCEKSLADARKHWDPEHYTFVFPRELTVGEQKTFDEKFGSLDITVDYWNGEELQGRLTGSEGGARVARVFFEDAEDRERQYQAIEAGGRLDTPRDAADRLSNIGTFLASRDAYFSYPATTHEQGGPSPPAAPGSVMSVARGDGTVESRIDVVPRDEEAMERYGPEFVLQPTEGEAGESAAQRLQEALGEGKAVEIDEGLDVTFTRMPPALGDVVGQRMTGGKVSIGVAQPVGRAVPPWKAQLRASSGEGDATLDVTLEPTESPPDGWDGVLSGTCGGLVVTALFRQRGEGGELNFNFRYQRTDAPVREQIEALAFMRAISASGELVITDRGTTGRPQLTMRTPVQPLADEHRALLAFLEDVHAIEEWGGGQFQLPDEVSAKQARDVAVVADLVRRRGRDLRWTDSEFTLRAEAVPQLREGGHVRIERAIAAKVLGREVELGYTQLDLGSYIVTSERPASKPGYMVVRIEPGSDASASVFERLVKERTRSKRPPPPPRQRKRKRGSKKRCRKKK